MQPMQRCKHFECVNGAPFGNASMWDVADGDGVVRLAAAAQRAALLPTYVSHAADALALAALGILVLGGMGRCDLARQVASHADSLLVLPGTLLLEMMVCTRQAAFIIVHGFSALLRWGLLALAAILILLALAEMARAMLASADISRR